VILTSAITGTAKSTNIKTTNFFIILPFNLSFLLTSIYGFIYHPVGETIKQKLKDSGLNISRKKIYPFSDYLLSRLAAKFLYRKPVQLATYTTSYFPKIAHSNQKIKGKMRNNGNLTQILLTVFLPIIPPFQNRRKDQKTTSKKLTHTKTIRQYCL